LSKNHRKINIFKNEQRIFFLEHSFTRQELKEAHTPIFGISYPVHFCSGVDIINNFLGKCYAKVKKLGRFTNEKHFLKFSKHNNFFYSGEKFSKKIVDNIDPSLPLFLLD